MVNGDVNIPTDMREALDDCKERCNAFVRNFVSKIEAKTIPDTIYHYTDQKGLLGILESGKIHVTDIFGLNDPSEVRHGINHVCNILTAEAKDRHPATREFADRIIEIINVGDMDKIASFYVACFSCDKEDLGQWRAYGDNGNGYAIGFDRKLLENAFIGQDGHNETFPISYDEDELCEIYKQIVKEVLLLTEMPEGKDLSNAIIKKFIKQLFLNLTILIFRVAVLFKHKAYENEKEYRFLKVRGVNEPNDDLEYRTRLNSVIRFTELHWKIEGQDILREIVIGPAADKILATSSANNCLRAAGFDPDSINISKSKIPYRNT